MHTPRIPSRSLSVCVGFVPATGSQAALQKRKLKHIFGVAARTRLANRTGSPKTDSRNKVRKTHDSNKRGSQTSDSPNATRIITDSQQNGSHPGAGLHAMNSREVHRNRSPSPLNVPSRPACSPFPNPPPQPLAHTPIPRLPSPQQPRPRRYPSPSTGVRNPNSSKPGGHFVVM